MQESLVPMHLFQFMQTVLDWHLLKVHQFSYGQKNLQAVLLEIFQKKNVREFKLK